MPAERSDIERLLERVLGFERDEGDHHWFKLYVGGKLVAMTRTSHSPKARTIDDSLLSKMARRDLRVPPRFLKDLLAGRKSREDDLDALRRQSLLPEQPSVSRIAVEKGSSPELFCSPEWLPEEPASLGPGTFAQAEGGWVAP